MSIAWPLFYLKINSWVEKFFMSHLVKHCRTFEKAPTTTKTTTTAVCIYEFILKFILQNEWKREHGVAHSKLWQEEETFRSLLYYLWSCLMWILKTFRYHSEGREKWLRLIEENVNGDNLARGFYFIHEYFNKVSILSTFFIFFFLL